MGKQNNKKAPYRMKVNVKFNNKYLQVPLEKGWTIQDLINHCTQKKPKKQKSPQKDNIKSFLSSCSDSGSDEQKIQYILTDETESFEFNPEYLCKDLLQKNEYIAIVELSPKQEQKQEKKEGKKEEEQKEQEKVEEVQQIQEIQEKVEEESQQCEQQQEKEKEEIVQVKSLESENGMPEVQGKLEKKSNNNQDIDDWEVLAEKQEEPQQENVNNEIVDDLSEDYETQDEEEIFHHNNNVNSGNVKQQQQNASEVSEVSKQLEQVQIGDDGEGEKEDVSNAQQ